MGTFIRTIEGPLVNVELAAKVFTERLGDGPTYLITFVDLADRPLGTCYGTLQQLYRAIHPERNDDGGSSPCGYSFH